MVRARLVGSTATLWFFVSACASASPQPAVFEAPAPATELRAWLAPDATPEPEALPALLDKLVPLLESDDPAVRDELAFTLLERWLRKAPKADQATKARLLERLQRRLDVDPATDGSDRVYGRSFAALALATLIRADADEPTFTGPMLVDAGRAAERYAVRERDLRGRDERGWIHPVAHVADVFSSLARHPNATSALEEPMLGTLQGFYRRSHGQRFAHGEDARWATAVIFAVQKAVLTPAGLDTWVKDALVVLGAPPSPEFDATRFAMTRNLRDLLISVVANFALGGAEDGPARKAYDTLLARLRG